MLQLLQKLLLHAHDSLLRYLHCGWMGLWVRPSGICSHLAHHSLLQVVRAQLWMYAENVRHVCALCTRSLVRGFISLLPSVQEGGMKLHLKIIAFLPWIWSCVSFSYPLDSPADEKTLFWNGYIIQITVYDISLTIVLYICDLSFDKINFEKLSDFL